MAWRVVQQPNGRFALFSDIVDNFICSGMTEAEVLHVCVERAGRDVANEKLKRAKENPGRWEESLRTVRNIHGADEAKRVAKELNGDG